MKSTNLQPARKDLRLQFKATREEEISHVIRLANQQSVSGHHGINNKSLVTQHKEQPHLLRQLINVFVKSSHFPGA